MCIRDRCLGGVWVCLVSGAGLEGAGAGVRVGVGDNGSFSLSVNIPFVGRRAISFLPVS